MDYIEFKLGVTVWSLELSDYEACCELQTICRLIDADLLDRSPAELYPATQPINRPSRKDSNVFLAIDLTGDPTDQMEIVALSVRCRNDVADDVENQLRAILQRSGVNTGLLRGNLGLTTPRV